MEAGWRHGEVMRSLRRLIAADNMTQKENAKVEAQLAIARAMIRAGRRSPDRRQTAAHWRLAASSW
ncbi:hypothetical protein [Mesorhizobium sp. M0522]|uniref:hypothetical protein n=1 Tax=Mesorhizobium sp. M0522 TaxID=2956958 RepID=UPI00333B9862